MTNPGRTKCTTRPLTRLTILLILVIVPISIAVMLFHHQLFGRFMTHGEQVKPPFSVSLLQLTNEDGQRLKTPVRSDKNARWTLLYFNPGLCEDACRKGLQDLRKVKTALGKNKESIQPVLLTYPSDLANKVAIKVILSENYPGTRHLTINEKNYTEVIRQHVHEDYAMQAGTIYLVNPQGKVTMTFEPGSKPAGILKDLKGLLKVN